MELENLIRDFKSDDLQLKKYLEIQINKEQDNSNLYSNFLKCLRDYLRNKIKSDQKILNQDMQELIHVLFYFVSISNIKETERHPSLLFCEDVYDCLSLSELSDFFQIFQSQLSIIQKFQENDKYLFLKISNSMLKRLSITHETDLRGKIHIFLTQIFGTMHKSGSRKIANNKDRGFQDEPIESNPQLPYSFYKNFWSLQKYINNLDLLLKGKISEFDEIAEENINDPQRLKNLQSLCKIIQRTLLYFRENQIEPINQSVKRFPRFLTKYQLFKDQLFDPSFRKVFLNQILLFTFVLENEQITNDEKQLLQPLKQEIYRQFEHYGNKLSQRTQNILETEKIWPQLMKEQFDNKHVDKLSSKVAEKFQRKQEIHRKIYDDLKIKPTNQFNSILQGGQEFKLSTNAIEPGLNYYLNDVISQIESTTQIPESEKYKSYKDYVWKSVRVMSKFLLKDLKITNLISNDKPLPNLEELVEIIRKADVKAQNP